MVPVIKGDGSVRICGDFKVTFNIYAKVEEYPLPLVGTTCLHHLPEDKFSVNLT